MRGAGGIADRVDLAEYRANLVGVVRGLADEYIHQLGGVYDVGVEGARERGLAEECGDDYERRLGDRRADPATNVGYNLFMLKARRMVESAGLDKKLNHDRGYTVHGELEQIGMQELVTEFMSQGHSRTQAFRHIQQILMYAELVINHYLLLKRTETEEVMDQFKPVLEEGGSLDAAVNNYNMVIGCNYVTGMELYDVQEITERSIGERVKTSMYGSNSSKSRGASSKLWQRLAKVQRIAACF